MKTIDFEALLPVARSMAEYAFPVLVPEHLKADWYRITGGREIPPQPFKSDGCTASPNWFGKEFCVLHDLAYWLGGTRKERSEADKRLREGTAKKSKAYSWVQWFGVRVFAWPSMPMPNARWGYGWPYPEVGEPGIKY